MSIRDKAKRAWDAFTTEDTPDPVVEFKYGQGYLGSSMGNRPDRILASTTNDRTIIASIVNKMSIDAASIELKHVMLDSNERYTSTIKSGLNECLMVEANIDQAATEFRQDIVMTMLHKGVAAIVPVQTIGDPILSNSYEIKSMRVGEVVEWYPKHIRISLYNEDKGYREEITLPKKMVAVVTNPLYSVMNNPNSTLKRLREKMNLLDSIDSKANTGKLDLIIQLPYTIRSETKKQQAEQRKKDIEFQLTETKYGIAYTDATEKITQLNRPIENNLQPQIQELKTELYSQLGLTEEILAGTADENAMLNYKNRTIKPIVRAISEALIRTFITKTGRTQGQSIMFYSNPFELTPISNVADIADKFTRNEIFTGNEMRGFMGFMPSDDPKADKLQNSNMPQPPEEPPPEEPAGEDDTTLGKDIQNES